MTNTGLFRTLLIGILGSLLTTRSVRGCFSNGNVETFEFSLTSLFVCQGRLRDSNTSLSNDEDSTPKSLQLGVGERGSIRRFWKDCGRQFYMLYFILRI